MKISWYSHTLQWWLHTWDPDFVNKLKDSNFLLKEFERQESIIYKWDNFLVVSKAAPYSSEDFMIIYSWKNSDKTSINSFDNIERWELFYLLNHINNKVLVDFDKELSKWTKELIIWINTSLLPWNWNVQSVSRPHFHITLLSNIEQDINNVSTKVLDILLDDENHQKSFCLRDINHTLIKKVHDSIISEKDFYLKSDLSNISCLDFELEDQNNLFSDTNIKIINKKYDFIYNMMKNSFHNIDWINHDRNSFSMWFKKINGIYKMRIRFFHKNPWDAWWIMESFNHLIVRNRVENPLLPDMRDFNKRISSYF